MLRTLAAPKSNDVLLRQCIQGMQVDAFLTDDDESLVSPVTHLPYALSAV